MQLNEDSFSSEIEEYRAYGLGDFSKEDSVPLSLKAFLFNRYARWAYSMAQAAEDYKEFYLSEYLGAKTSPS